MNLFFFPNLLNYGLAIKSNWDFCGFNSIHFILILQFLQNYLRNHFIILLLVDNFLLLLKLTFDSRLYLKKNQIKVFQNEFLQNFLSS